MNDELDLKHTTVCLLIYGGGGVLAAAFWYGVFRLFCLAVASWQAGVMTALVMLLAVAGADRFVVD
jgi:hypothetical protein